MRLASTIALGLLIGCSGGESGSGDGDKGDWDKGADAGPKEPVTVVEVDVVRKGSVADTLIASAIVESESSADLIPETSGVVVSVHKDEGDVVRKGDLLAVLKNVTLGTGAAQSANEVKRLELQVRESRELAARGALSERDLREMEYQLETARLSSREARTSYGSTRLTAPFDGVVAMRDVRVGELAGSGRAAFTVVDLDALRVVASLPERDLRRVAVGQPADLVSAYDVETTTTGVVQRVAPVIDAASGTFRVTIGLDPEQDVLRPGQFVSVTLEVDRHDDVWVVPKQSVVYEDGAPVVYAVVDAPPPEDDADDEDSDGDDAEESSGSWWPFGGDANAADDGEGAEGDEEGAEGELADEGPPLVAERTAVTLALVDAEFAEISEGFEGGETVITVGQSHLRDGARVRAVDTDVDKETAAGAGAATPGPAGSEAGDEG